MQVFKLCQWDITNELDEHRKITRIWGIFIIIIRCSISEHVEVNHTGKRTSSSSTTAVKFLHAVIHAHKNPCGQFADCSLVRDIECELAVNYPPPKGDGIQVSTNKT